MQITYTSWQLLRILRPQILSRLFSQASVRWSNYEGERIEATTMTMLSQENTGLTYISAYSKVGFRLNSGFRIIGPCAVFPRSILHWNVKNSEAITIDALSLFTILVPKIDILVLGIGSTGSKYDKDIIKYLRSNKINVEVLPTDQACATFNFLNAEHRCVAGALIPPDYISFDDDDNIFFKEQMKQKELLEPDEEQLRNLNALPGGDSQIGSKDEKPGR